MHIVIDARLTDSHFLFPFFEDIYFELKLRKVLNKKNMI
jgi:hypothetical protein